MVIDPKQLEELRQARRQWEATTLRGSLEQQPERATRFSTLSEMEIARLYAPDDLPAYDPARDLGLPGEYPFTRGIHPTMYRGRLWTMRQFAGFGSPEDSNRRFHYLLEHGQTGLSVAFDMPTLMGYDSDHARAQGEVGREGVAVDTLEDMEILFRGLPLDRITTSMTINAPANVLLAMYLVAAERAGYRRDQLGGTTQTDMLKEFIAQKEWIVPPRPSMRLIQDMLAFGTRELMVAPLSPSDRRRVPHRATAAEQHRPCDPAGPGRRVGRDAITAHQLHGRDVRVADGRGSHDRTAHAADHRLRERRDQHGRSAGRVIFRGGPDQPCGGRGGGIHPEDRRPGRHGASR